MRYTWSVTTITGRPLSTGEEFESIPAVLASCSDAVHYREASLFKLDIASIRCMTNRGKLIDTVVLDPRMVHRWMQDFYSKPLLKYLKRRKRWSFVAAVFLAASVTVPLFLLYWYCS